MGSLFRPLSMRSFIFYAFLWVLIVLCHADTCNAENCEIWVDWRRETNPLGNGTLEDPIGSMVLANWLLANNPACAQRAVVNLTPGGIYNNFYTNAIADLTYRRCVECPNLNESNPTPSLPPVLGPLWELSTISSDPNASPSYRGYLQAIQGMNPMDEVFIPFNDIETVANPRTNLTFENLVFYLADATEVPERARRGKVDQETQSTTTSDFPPSNTTEAPTPNMTDAPLPNIQKFSPGASTFFLVPSDGRLTFLNVLFLGSHRLTDRSLIAAPFPPSTLILNNVTVANFRLQPGVDLTSPRGSSLLALSKSTFTTLQNCLFYNNSYQSNLPNLDFNLAGAAIASTGSIVAHQTAFVNCSTLYFPNKIMTSQRVNQFYRDGDFLRVQNSKPSSDHHAESFDTNFDANLEDFFSGFGVHDEDDNDSGSSAKLDGNLENGYSGFDADFDENLDDDFQSTPHFRKDENDTAFIVPEMHGGAVAINDGNFELRGGWFLYNSVRMDGVLLDKMMLVSDPSSFPSGGALSCVGSAEVYLFNVRFEQNEAPFGAAISSGSSAKDAVWNPRTVNFSHRSGSFISNHALISAADLWTRGYTTSLIFFRDIVFFSPQAGKYIEKRNNGLMSEGGKIQDEKIQQNQRHSRKRSTESGIDASRLALSLSLEHDNNYAPSFLMMIACTYRGDASIAYSMRLISVHGFSLVTISTSSFSQFLFFDCPVIHATHVAEFKLKRAKFHYIVNVRFTHAYLQDSAFILVKYDQSTSPWGDVPAKTRNVRGDTPNSWPFYNRSLDSTTSLDSQQERMRLFNGFTNGDRRDEEIEIQSTPQTPSFDHSHPSETLRKSALRWIEEDYSKDEDANMFGDEKTSNFGPSDFRSQPPDSQQVDSEYFDTRKDLGGCPLVTPPGRAPFREPKISVVMENVTFERVTTSWSLVHISYVDKVRLSQLDFSEVEFPNLGVKSTFESELLDLSDIRQYAILNQISAFSISAAIHATRVNAFEMINSTLTFPFSRRKGSTHDDQTTAMRKSKLHHNGGDDWKQMRANWEKRVHFGNFFSDSKSSTSFNQQQDPAQRERKESYGALIVKHCGSVYLSGSIFAGYQTISTRVTPVMIEGTVGSVYVVDSIFVNNGANQDGGALSISSFSASSAVILRCSFIGNSATLGGAISSKSSLIVIESEFLGNRASYAGGAIYAVGPIFCTSLTSYNTNGANATGGAVVFAGYGVSIATNSTFTSNYVGPYEAGLGGAISLINARYFSSYYTSFKLNSAPNGGAISFTKDSSQVSSSQLNSRSRALLHHRGTGARMDEAQWRSLKRIIIATEGQASQPQSATGESFNSAKLTSQNDFFEEDQRSFENDQRSDAVRGNPDSSRVIIAFSQFVGNEIKANTYSVDPAVRADLGIWPSDLSEQKTYRGGALFVSDLDSLQISGTQFVRNLARVGGAIYASPLAGFAISATTFAHNNASYAGGAVAIYSKYVNDTRSTKQALGINWDQTTFAWNSAMYGGAVWMSAVSPAPISIQRSIIANNTASLGSVWYHSGHELTIPALMDTTLQGNKPRKAASAIFFNGPPLTDPQRLQNFCSIDYACQQFDDSLGPEWIDTKSASSGFNLTVLLAPQFPSNIKNRTFATTPFAPRVIDYGGGGDSTDNILSTDSNCRLVNPHHPWPIDDGLRLSMPSDQVLIHSYNDVLIFHPGNLSIDFNLKDALDQRIDDRNTYSTCFSLAENENERMKVLLRPATINSGRTTTVSVTVAVRSDLVDQRESIYIRGSQVGKFSVNSTLIVGLENISASTGSTWSIEPYRFKAIPLTLVKLNIQGCPRGYGLAHVNSEPDYSVCAPCSEGTYNLDGDGRCWLCDDPELPYTLVTCSGANVRPTTGVYVLPSTHDNSFLTFACPYGYCTNCSASSSEANFDKQCPFGDCAEGRDPNSCLCGACATGYSESLLFDTCSRHWCRTPNYLAFVLVLLALAAAALILHHFWFFHPSATSLLLFFLQVLPLVHVDFLLLLQRSHTLAGFFCLAPATPLQRLVFFQLIPLYLAATILITFLLRFTILYLYRLFRHCIRSLTSRTHRPVGLSNGKTQSSSSVLPSSPTSASSPDWDENPYNLIDAATENLLVNDAAYNLSNSSDESIISFGSLDSEECLLASDFIMIESTNDTIQGKKAKFLEDRPTAPSVLRVSAKVSDSTESSSLKVPDQNMGGKKELISKWDQRVRLPYFHTARLTRSLIALWILTIIPTTKLAFDFLHCVAIEERPTVWFVAPSVSCTSRSFILLRNVAIPFILVSVISLIGLFFFTMKLYRNVVMGQSKRLKLLLHLAYFFDSYRPGLYFWMLLHISLRIVLPLTVSLSFIKPGPLNFATSIVLLSATLVQAFSWSYTDIWDNIFSSILLTTLTVSSLLRESSFQSSVVGYAPPTIIVANYVLLLVIIIAMVAVQLVRYFYRSSS